MERNKDSFVCPKCSPTKIVSKGFCEGIASDYGCTNIETCKVYLKASEGKQYKRGEFVINHR